MPVTINLTLECDAVAVDEPRLRAAIEQILAEDGIQSAEIGVAVLSDTAIRKLNKQYLNHDYATDAISFVLHQSASHIEGEIAVSAETARRKALRLGWAAADEMLLYIVHGALHLVGEDDTTEAAASAMRRREREVLSTFGLTPPWDDCPASSEGRSRGSGPGPRNRKEPAR